jgi:hypothetical protein
VVAAQSAATITLAPDNCPRGHPHHHFSGRIRLVPTASAGTTRPGKR